MTANENNSAESENSVFQSPEDSIHTSANDPVIVQLAQYAYETAGATTRRDLVTQTELSPSEIDEYLRRLSAAGYADFIGDLERRAVLLTNKGERFVREATQ